MQKDLIKLALKIATEAHKGRFRKDGKTPYITHPIAVAKIFEGKQSYTQNVLGYNLKTLQIIALLHDVVEDSNIKCIELKNRGMSFEIVDAVAMLTRTENKSYLNYLLDIKTNILAKFVKIEDIKHNLSTLDSKNKTMKDKYELALYILEQ